MPGAEVVAVSAKTGDGLDELRAALGRVAERVEHARARPSHAAVRRPVVLRSAASGRSSPGRSGRARSATGDELRLEPSGRDVRVRSVQVHDRDVDRAEPGQRVAVEPSRGRARRGRAGRRARRAGRVSGLLPARRRARRARADRRRRAAPGPPRHGARPRAGRARRRALRAAAARVTGRRRARRPRRSSAARRRSAAASCSTLRRRGIATRRAWSCSSAATSPRRSHAPVRVDSLRFVLDGELDGRRARGAVGLLGGVARRARATISARASPLPTRSIRASRCPRSPGRPTSCRCLPFERRGVEALPPGRGADARRSRAEAARALERELASAGVHATKVDDDELARFLEASGRLVRLGDGYAIGADAFEVAQGRAARRVPRQRARSRSRASATSLGIGRRDAQLLLERFDADGLTRRIGERRVLRQAARRVVGAVVTRGGSHHRRQISALRA